MSHTTPSHVAQHHFDAIVTCLPGVMNGDMESVHQARIETRRLRVAIPLLDVGPHIANAIKKAGRQLGRVRELDVMGELLDSLGSQVPTAAAHEWQEARHAVRERQRSGRRRMVKALERLDLESLRSVFHRHSWRLFGRSWVESVWNQVLGRSRDAVAAVDRAPAVYLPNRAHQARIATKKLRYAIELAGETGVWLQDRVLRDLRQIQGLLGDVHDAQVLADALDDLLPRPQPATASTSFVKALLDAEIARKYARYAKRRDRVGQIAAACARACADAHRRWRYRAPLLAASVVVAPALIEAVGPLSRRQPMHG